ncbi:MAG TPA: AMP-binding protein [Dongiaceae bacterium]|nr:AMP-binding protein [Dongiaceae bacterium]
MSDKTPLESWIARKIGLGGSTVTREKISHYQLQKVRETLRWARSHSPFYKQRFSAFSENFPASFAHFASMPFTDPDDLQEQGLQFLCVPQGDIDRVVTLESSGTSGAPKRVFFTADDKELTVDFFRVGMSQLLKSGESVLIALPFVRPGSVGDLLAIAVRRLGARPVLCGPITAAAETVEVMQREQVECAVGLPVQILSLVRASGRDVPSRFLNTVLLCSDYVPDSIVHTIQSSWQCEVFEHYGMTEMGLGGGVDCAAHAGYHLREADLYLEIVDPESGAPLPAGEAGEIVVTTLTRRGMPFIRYRTGDLSRLRPESCPCGTVLQRLDRVRGRKTGRIAVGTHKEITMATLDDVLFGLPEVNDFSAAVDGGKPSKLIITVYGSGREEDLPRKAREALGRVPEIHLAERSEELQLVVNAAKGAASSFNNKRRIA